MSVKLFTYNLVSLKEQLWPCYWAGSIALRLAVQVGLRFQLSPLVSRIAKNFSCVRQGLKKLNYGSELILKELNFDREGVSSYHSR